MKGWSEVTLPDPVCLMRLDGQIVWVNDRFTELVGYTLEEMLARPRFSLMHPDDAATVAASLPVAFSGGAGLRSHALRVRLAAKGDRWIAVNVTTRLHLPDDDSDEDDETLLVISLREHEDAWEGVVTTLASDDPLEPTVQRIAEALCEYDLDVALSVGTESGRKQFPCRCVPPAVLPALTYLHQQLDDGKLELVDGVVRWDDLAGLPDRDRHHLAAHGYELAVVHRLDDPAGMGEARIVSLFTDEAGIYRVAGLSSRRPHEYFALALLARHRRRELVHAATHDALTGLPNRGPFFRRITELGNAPVGLLFVDLDGFKPVNDAYGHSAGDLVLVEVARRLRWCVRPDDLAARLGGDEFGVVCAGVARVDFLSDMAERLVHKVAEPIGIGSDQLVSVGASIGVALGPARNPSQIVEAADAAMYVAKTSGKSRWSVTEI